MAVSYDTEWELQVAIKKHLSADQALTGVLGNADKILDWVPASNEEKKQTPQPYITIGDATANEWDTKTKTGEDLTVTFHIWSTKHAGRKQIKIIQGHLKRLLHDELLTVEGHSMVLARREFTTSMLDPDGLTIHGIARYRYIVQSV